MVGRLYQLDWWRRPAAFRDQKFPKACKGENYRHLVFAERSNLLAAAKTHEDQFGWTIVADPSTGVRIGLPIKLVARRPATPRGDTLVIGRWRSAGLKLCVKDPDLKLATFFEQQKKDPSIRKVESSYLRDDILYIRGMQGLKKFLRARVCARRRKSAASPSCLIR